MGVTKIFFQKWTPQGKTVNFKEKVLIHSILSLLNETNWTQYGLRPTPISDHLGLTFCVGCLWEVSLYNLTFGMILVIPLPPTKKTGQS